MGVFGAADDGRRLDASGGVSMCISEDSPRSALLSVTLSV